MATGARPALGLSIGVTNLAAVAADHSITRKPVLTLYRQRPPEVGVPSENPRLDEPGLVITDFVDRVGDSVGIVAADGSVYRSEALVADALLALAYTATGGRALPGSVTVTYPAHWGPAAVAALDSALRRASDGRTGLRVRPSHCHCSLTPRQRCTRYGPTRAYRPVGSSRYATSVAAGPASRSSTPQTSIGRWPRRCAIRLSPAI